MAFTLVGLAVWIGVTVAVTVVHDDPSDPGPTLTAFVACAAAFFSLMFGAALVQQLGRDATTPEARFGKRVAIGYTLTGIVVTALGLGAIWAGGIADGVDVRLFIYPLVAIVAGWAAVALWLIRRYTGGPQT